MANIKITLNELSTFAQSLRNHNRQLDEELASITKCMNEMEEGWSSEASRAILASFEHFSRIFLDESEVIEEYARFLDNTVTTYETLESTLTGNAGNLNG